jgi:hypothetical protein
MGRRPKRVFPAPLHEDELDEYGSMRDCHCPYCTDRRRLLEALELTDQMREFRRRTERHPKRGATAGGVLGDLSRVPQWVRPTRD